MVSPGVPQPSGAAQARTSKRLGFGRRKSDGIVWTSAGLASVLTLLAPPMDTLSDSNLTVHMFQHLGIFVGGILLGYGLEVLVVLELPRIRKATYAGWRVFTGLMRVNSYTRGSVFLVVVPALVFAYWHLPANFDLAVQNESVHALEHLSYLSAGALAGMSIQAVSRKWRVVLLYLGFMNLGMMGSMWTVWRPPYFPIYSLSSNLEMGTAVMLFGALGVVGTSSYLLRVMDII